MSSDERTVSTNATSTNPNPPPPRTRHPSQVHNKATFYQYRSERFNEMQTCIEDIVAKRVHIVDDLCKKSLKPHAEIEISYAIKNYFVYDCFNSLFVFISR